MPYEAKTNWKYDDTVTEKDLNRIEQGLKDAHVAEYKDITLQPGVQIVDVPEDTPFRMGEIRGRTLVNLLGRSWSAYGGKMSFGDGMYTIEGSGTVPNPQLSANLTSTGFVPKVGDLLFLRSKCRVDNTTCKAIGLYFYSKSTDRNYAAEIIKPMANQVYVIGGIIEVTQAMIDDWADMIAVVAYEYNTNGDALNTVNKVSEVAMYRVSESVSGQSISELLASYPYVDSMTNVTNPYAIGTSRNLLPPFTEWNLYESVKVLTPYSIELNATQQWQTSHIIVPIEPEGTYTLSAQLSGSTSGYLHVWGLDLAGKQVPPSLTTDKSKLGDVSITFKCAKEAVRLLVAYTSENATGRYVIEKPMLVPGDKPQPFAPQLRSMWATEFQLAANPLDGSNEDVLYVGDDGLPYVLEKWKTTILDGQYIYDRTTVQNTGFKSVMIKGLARNSDSQFDNDDEGKLFATKYDGKLLAVSDIPIVNWSKADLVRINDEHVYFTISNTDSGWGDSYEPTSEEIKAYFLGWKMGNNEDYSFPAWNGKGTKAWYKLYNGVGPKHPGATDAPIIEGTYSNTVPTKMNDTGYTPYSLQYLKAKPTTEPASNYETGLTLSKGWNMVEVGSGVVIREKANPTYYSPNGNYYINNTAVSGSLLKNKVSRMPRAYRNGWVDNTAKIENDANAYGKQHVRFLPSNYDPTAVYHVTYTMLDPTLSATISGSIAANLRGTVTDMVAWASDTERRLSVVETKKAEKESPSWITPALLNGWVKWDDRWAPPQYYKDDNGIVHLRGLIKGGVIDGNTAIFILPQGYRPSHSSCHATYSQGSGGVDGVLARIDISGATGSVYPTRGSSELLSLEGISFRAEK
ncbi:hypothetical protein M5X00_20415 [Paenibacillus alvei]|uniref:hypothetical protein n=1 Tax=Paenibacillus alvei TaxID=44250 RepID=UPI000288972D|nr:hypothetical protein [Paenibacillus alvei]EJW16536.1 hypothetical protein PAV_5c01160 [Paenibacillus alvei DSM 29]MCY9542375.1 hypothetical protein [Paenibacillus alvei]MCY9704226.1 hypothetical protein [Paenibacillus alvei]MCY9733505.1 hypothetical protein [Paenibacillus alvei]MCY9756608.1 hypothetical protein [Paenibacillus alvei]